MPERRRGDEEALAMRGDTEGAHPDIEEARRVALDRLIELERWVGKATLHKRVAIRARDGLPDHRADGSISAAELLRVLHVSGLLRDAAHRPEDQRPDEVEQRRERDRRDDG